MRIILALALALYALMLFACARRGNHETTLMPQTEHSLPLIYVPETHALPGNFSARELALPPNELAHFEQHWQRLKPRVRAHVQTDSVRAISLWAKEEMENFSLPQTWLEKIPLRVMAATEGDLQVRFGQFKEEGLPLPSHRPLVFRRLVLFVDYDRRTQTITRITISINGWVEE